MGQRVVEMDNLTKIFGEKLIAVNNVNFAVEEGAIFGFLGPNGAGKTTTIRLLLGLIRPTAGEVRVFGERMTPGRVGPAQADGLPSHEPAVSS